MSKIFRISLFILLLVPCFAFGQEWVGFKKVEGNTDIPHYKDVLASVFQMYTYNAPTEDRFEVVSTFEEEQITQTDILDTDLRALQIETCRRYAMKKCPVSTVRSISTVVLSGGKRLQGCRHSFHNWLAMGSKLNNRPIQLMHVPMIIFNYKGEVVYNSAYSPARFDIIFINTSDRLNTVYDYRTFKLRHPKFHAYRSLTDSITILFSSNISDSKSFAAYTPPSKGDQVYTYGYPARTEYFGGVKKGDAPGDVLVASSGRLTDYVGARQYISINAPSGPGGSGGPILNINGALLGFVCAGDPSSSSGPINKYDDLTILWDKLEDLTLD